MKIVISGTTGVGKSTTVKKLSDFLEKQNKKVFVSEELVVDSPFFDLYFKDLEEWGFIAQIDFLLERFRGFVKNELMDKKYKKKYNKKVIFIYDRHFLEDKIFSRLNLIKKSTPKMLTNSYKNVYNQLVAKLLTDFGKIDYFIMLKADFDEVEKRMNQRGRKEEMNFPKDYWLDLYNGYYSDEENRKILRKYSKKFIEINTTNLTPDQVLDTILSHILYKKKK